MYWMLYVCSIMSCLLPLSRRGEMCADKYSDVTECNSIRTRSQRSILCPRLVTCTMVSLLL